MKDYAEKTEIKNDPDGTQPPTLPFILSKVEGHDLEVDVTTIKLIFKECAIKLIN